MEISKVPVFYGPLADSGFTLLVKGCFALEGLGDISNGVDFSTGNAVLGMDAEEVDIAGQVVELSGHGFQDSERGPGVVNGPVTVDGLLSKPVSLNRVTYSKRHKQLHL